MSFLGVSETRALQIISIAPRGRSTPSVRRWAAQIADVDAELADQAVRRSEEIDRETDEQFERDRAARLAEQRARDAERAAEFA